ncbi:High-affinity choline transporter 1, partial [Gryllus bimaculatus]
MCSDLVYCILFPQLLMVVHFKHHCNTYGSLAAYIIAFLVRISGGEPMLGLPALIHYPGWLFESGKLAPGYDWFRCVVNIPEDVERVGEPAEGEQMSVMSSGQIGRVYGAATMVGKDEMNGRINPALEPDDDMDPAEVRGAKRAEGRATGSHRLASARGGARGRRPGPSASASASSLICGRGRGPPRRARRRCRPHRRSCRVT